MNPSPSAFPTPYGSPEDALARLPDDTLSFLLFPVDRPELFDAVVTDAHGHVERIDVKQPNAGSHWIWGAVKMPGHVFRSLYDLWCEPGRRDEYLGTLVNAWLARGNRALGIPAGSSYVDVGTLNGYREAITLLTDPHTTTEEPVRSVAAAQPEPSTAAIKG